MDDLLVEIVSEASLRGRWFRIFLTVGAKSVLLFEGDSMAAIGFVFNFWQRMTHACQESLPAKDTIIFGRNVLEEISLLVEEGEVFLSVRDVVLVRERRMEDIASILEKVRDAAKAWLQL